MEYGELSETSVYKVGLTLASIDPVKIRGCLPKVSRCCMSSVVSLIGVSDDKTNNATQRDNDHVDNRVSGYSKHGNKTPSYLQR